MPSRRSDRIALRVEPEVVAMLDALADESGLTASDVVRSLIRREYQAKFPNKKVPKK